MGIPKVQTRILAPANQVFSDIISKQRPVLDIESMWIDANAVVYRAAASVCGYDDNSTEADYNAAFRMTEADRNDAIIAKTISLIQDMLATYKPTKLVCVAIDGVVPLAKQDQQRRRRYLAVKERARGVSPGARRQESARLLFDTTIVTPGTPFMAKLDLAFQQTLPSLDILNRSYDVIYSSYREPGEGEHKIMDLLREGLVSKNGTHVIVSADSDMVILASSLDMKRLYVYRDMQGTWFSSSPFRYYLQTNWGLGSTMDFLLLVQLVGNDFLPPQASMMPSAQNVLVTRAEATTTIDAGTGFVTLEEAYTRVVSSRRIVDGEEISWPILKKVLGLLAEDDYERLYAAHGNYDPTDARWSREVFPQNVKLSEMSHDERQRRYSMFRDAWYAMALPNYSVEERVDVIKDMVREYLRGMVWVLLYYTKGLEAVNPDWVYPYRHAPLLTDIVAPDWEDMDRLIDSVRQTEENSRLLSTVAEQLTITMPTESVEKITQQTSIDVELSPYIGLQALQTAYPEHFPSSETVEVDYIGIPEEVKDKEIQAIDLPIITVAKLRELTTIESLERVDPDAAETVMEWYDNYKNIAEVQPGEAVILERNRQFIQAKAVDMAASRPTGRGVRAPRAPAR